MNNSIKNKCIKVLDKIHGAEVIKFFENNGAANSKYLVGSCVGKYYFTTGCREIDWQSTPPSGYTEIQLPSDDNNMQKQRQTLKRKRLIELHDQFSCQQWKQNIVEILDLAPILATDDTYIEIPKDKIELLFVQGSKAQIEASGLKGIPTFKVGDWVCIIQENLSRSGDIFQLTEDNFKNVASGYDISYHYTSWSFPYQVRLATKEEIEQVNCPYKDGELIWVYWNGWNLRYSAGKVNNGSVEVYLNQQKSGTTALFTHHRKATDIILPPTPAETK